MNKYDETVLAIALTELMRSGDVIGLLYVLYYCTVRLFIKRTLQTKYKYKLNVIII